MSTWTDGPVTVLVGDVLARLAELPDASVHCCVTSPPYWGLRDYGTAQWEGGDPGCDHRESRPSRTAASIKSSGLEGSKATTHASHVYGAECGRCGARRIDSQLGLEPTPEEYVCRMVEVFGEVRRVLRPDGTLWLNLGDSYAATSKGSGGTNSTTIGHGSGQASNRGSFYSVKLSPGLKPKDLVGIPWRVAFALQADGWWLRSDVIWSKPNPMPESVTDRPTTAHEHVFMLTRSPRYFYDAEAVREKWAESSLAAHTGRPTRTFRQQDYAAGAGRNEVAGHGLLNGAGRFEKYTGRNLRSVWTIATQPYPEAHFATFPEELARRCIAAGTSERGCCPECGAPWRRVVDVEYVKSPVHGNGSVVGRHYTTGQNNFDGAGMPRVNKQVTTTGWQPTCAHDGEPVPTTVLDPFAGSGTTLAVARRMGRRAVGIELQADYLPLIRRRVEAAARPPLLEYLDAQTARRLGSQ